MQLQKIFKAGNSNVVAIPKTMADSLGLKKGSTVCVEMSPDKKSIVISDSGNKQYSSVTPDFMRRIDSVNKRYGPALKKLAKL